MGSPHTPEEKRVSAESFGAQRYCDIPFAAYRFIPGQTPHPTADPRGHSYRAPGTPEPEVALVLPDAWATSADYLYGCDLYNHAYWWEAHEAWEGLWQLADKEGIQGLFLQGLIQSSACHLKQFVGHANGVVRLRRSSIGYLRTVLDRLGDASYMGLDLVASISHFESYYHALCSQPKSRNEHAPATYPYLRLRC